MPRYLIHFLVATTAIAGLIIGVNWYVDPFGIYRSDQALQHPEKPFWIANERVFKTVRLSRTPADVIFLGSSRTDIGIGPQHEVFAGKKILNLASFAQDIEESHRLMTVSVENAKPGIVVAGLDFFAFNALATPPDDFVEENYSDWRALNLLLSISSLDKSKKVLKVKQKDIPGSCCDGNGFRYPLDLQTLKGTYKPNFRGFERDFLLKDKWIAYPRCVYAFDNQNGKDMLENFRAMVRLAHQHKTDLRMFISPAHARIWETLATAGLWQQWEQWKTELVNINEQEAVLAGAQPFPLWDFSHYDDISSEAVPEADDQQTAMKWYIDSSHYTRDLGKKIVQRMFGATEDHLFKSWGKMIKSSNLADHLQSIRKARRVYEDSHPNDLAEIRESANEVEKMKQCPNKFLELPSSGY